MAHSSPRIIAADEESTVSSQHEALSPPKTSLQRQTSRELPSRSYYASHAKHETNGELQYSASIESIRAQSLALGDLGMNEGPDPDIGKPRQSNDEFIISPSPRTQPNTSSSNLSYLFKYQNQKETDIKASKSNDERSPLIERLPSSTSPSVEYQTISPMRTDETSIRSARDRRGSVKSYSDTGRYQPFWSRLCGRVSEKTRFTSLKDPDTWINMVKRPIECIPAVILGLLLNLLDAISYGMITFPLNNPIFAAFGPDGISMFFVSCIVAQLVYSGGGSCFEGGNGSMMIEVVPFLHIIAEQIIQSIGEDEPGRIVSSTVVAFAISSMMTGLAFFLLGALKLGSLIGFFPRHILVGTIGGVGWFLVATGIEVSARLTENLAYNLPMLRKLFLDTHTFALWSSSLGVAILLRIIQHRVSSPLVVPAFFMILPFAFYFVCVIFGLDIGHVRDAGWIFPLVESDLPFWHFYTYYDLTLVDWSAILKTLPAMLALTFFGLLHVPINVPALGVSTNKDDVDVNRELVAHGLSNAISGCLGAVQNYLVYTNSLLFIRSGGDSRLAGFMLAGATAIVWMIGPWIVGYIPVMVVGSLIFHLGLDLLKEALIDTWHSVHYLEYITICAIIACMSILGFVEGILVGIIMACIFFVVQKARRSQAIRASLSGRFMRSTVRRVYRQQRFLHYVSNQIQVIKLQGYLFFGTINQVERAIRDMLDERVWDVTPVRFVILDMQLVQGLDFSAAEAFVRIRRLLGSRDVYMIICNVARQSDEEKALAKSGMWMDEDNSQQTDLKCFQYLNDALEWCENVLLESYFAKMSQRRGSYKGTASMPRFTGEEVTQTDSLPSVASPRQKMLTKAVKDILEESQAPVIHSNMTQPMMILVQTYSELSSETVPVEFYHKLATYFERMTLRRGQVLYREGDPCDYMLVLEQGCLRSLMRVNHQDVTVESILPGSIVGELGLFTGSDGRTRSMVAEQDSVLWKLTKASLDKMLTEEPHMANKFILLSLHFSSDHLDTMTRYAFQLH